MEYLREITDEQDPFGEDFYPSRTYPPLGRAHLWLHPKKQLQRRLHRSHSRGDEIVDQDTGAFAEKRERFYVQFRAHYLKKSERMPRAQRRDVAMTWLEQDSTW